MPVPAPTPPAAARPQLPPPRVALGLFGESLAHRVELTALELHEAREHAARSVVLAAVVATLGICTGLALTLLVAGLVWDSPARGWWLAGLTVVYLAGTAAAAFSLRHRLRTWQPLREIQTQLSQDYQCLNQLFKSIAP